MQSNITGIADMIHSQHDKAPTAEISFNRKNVKGITAKLAFNCDTFYSPPGAALSNHPIITIHKD
jgi:hypothetical protein